MSALTRPLILSFLCFAAGLTPALRYGGEVGPGMIVVLYVAAGGCAALGLGTWAAKGSRAELLAAFFLLGVALGVRGNHEMRSDCRHSLVDGGSLRLEGVLEASHFGPNEHGRVPLLPLGTRAVSARGAALVGCGGSFRVRLPPSAPEIPAGAFLAVFGEWRPNPPPPVPSRWPRDPRTLGWVRADSVHVLDAVGAAANPILSLRGRSESGIRTLAPDHADLVEALVLGRRERLDPGVREKFARAGLSHLLAISGMHVGILAGVLLVIGRVARVPRPLVTWLTITLIGAYLVFIGAPPSAVRAGSMISLALWAMRLQRPFEPLGLIVAAAFAILAMRPQTLLEPGFQLSFLGVIGILVARRTVLQRLPGSLRAVKGGEWLTESLVVSGAAFAATAPVVAWHFGLLAPVAILANLPAVPVLGLALVGFLLAAATTPIAPPLGNVFASASATMLDLLDRIASIAAVLPYGHGWVTRPQAATWVAAVSVGLVMAWFTRAMRAPVRGAVAGGALLASLLLVPAVSARAELGGARLEIHFLDVGQGDATAIRSPAGRWVLIDAGPAEDGFDAGERRVLPFLRAHGVQRLELMILTHPHRDHIGGAPAILRSLEVGAVVEPGYAYSSPLYLDVLKTIERTGTSWRAARNGRTIRLDGMELHLLWPDESLLASATDANEISAVVHLRFGSFSALFTGDAYDTAEWELVKRHGEALRSQVLKAGHHGSYTSTTPELLDAVRPEVVVISAGRRNRFGHPSPEVLRELRRRGLRVARTDQDGTISIRVDTTWSRPWRMDDSP